MTRWFGTAWLPMLRKEMTERAARKRTYVVRVLYAAAFFVGFLTHYHQLTVISPFQPQGGMQGLQALGQGDEIFRASVAMQLIGIVLFLPAMMCGLITDEKERGSFQLLLLTDISPLEGVTQKYLSGLIPMLSLLLLTLPVGGFAYLIGGLTIEMVLKGVILLLVIAITVGAIALACSSFLRTTVGAFMATYVILAGLYFADFLEAPSLNGALEMEPFYAACALITLVALLIAWGSYRNRADASPRHYLRRFFQALDRKFRAWNARIGNVELIKDRKALPEMDPIAWREKHRRQFGQARYQIRYLTFIVIIVVGVGVLSLESAHIAAWVAWIVGLLLLAAQSSNLFVSERLAQSLDVLLVTPLTGADMVKQKVKALLPLMLILGLPIFCLALMHAYAESITVRRYGYGFGHRGSDVSLWMRAIIEAIHIIVLFALTVCLGVAFGLRARGRVAAMMKVIGVLVAMAIVPLALIWMGRFRSR